MRLLSLPSDSSDYEGGLFSKQELVWLNLCSRVYTKIHTRRKTLVKRSLHSGISAEPRRLIKSAIFFFKIVRAVSFDLERCQFTLSFEEISFLSVIKGVRSRYSVTNHSAF